MTKTIAAFAVLLLASSAWAKAPTKEEIKDILQKNPDILLDVLKQNKKQLFDIVNEAAQEEQARREKDEADAEKKEFDDAFKNPKQPDIASKDTHVRGNDKAKYTLVEYSDFQCPYCGRGFQTVETLRKKYGDNLKFIYKDMPLPFHPMAMPAAKYFEAAMLQSSEKAWQLHDKMFENQQQLSDQWIKDTAKSLGLNVKKLEKDAQSDVVAKKIQADQAEAQTMGFSGTPGFLLNGIPVKGAYPVEYFDGIIARLEGKTNAAADKN